MTNLLDIPPKLLRLLKEFDNYRYFLIEGGRSSGKSQTVSRLLIYLAEKKKLRIVCGRETQNTIEESVYTIFKDLISQYNLAFDVLKTTIDHKVSKSTLRFRGFREQGALNIMGLEGCDILWVEQAEALTKQTIDILLPTIRKEYSKIIFTMNRYVENDPTYMMFITRPDCLHIHIDYLDNPFCPQKMIDEAEISRVTNEEDYRHIWLGEPLKQGDDYLFNSVTVEVSDKNDFVSDGIRKRIIAVDVARFGEDETVFSVIESRGMFNWAQLAQETWKHKSLMECVGKTIDMSRQYSTDMVVIDDTGIGGGVTDRLKEMKINVVPFNGAEKPRNYLYSNARGEGFFRLKELFDGKRIKILNDMALKEQLQSIRYKFKSNGEKAIISKDEMRKKGIRSPDRADALMMAVYFSDKVFANTDRARRTLPQPVPIMRPI